MLPAGVIKAVLWLPAMLWLFCVPTSACHDIYKSISVSLSRDWQAEPTYSLLAKLLMLELSFQSIKDMSSPTRVDLLYTLLGCVTFMVP